MMRIVGFFFLFHFLACTPGRQETVNQKDATKFGSVDSAGESDTETDFRQEFIALYHQKLLIDTFFYEEGKKYEIVFNHFSTTDSGLIVPSKYNFDIQEDFITHNFASDITLLSDKDTLFYRTVTRSTFDEILDTVQLPLQQYGTLLYPALTVKEGNIIVRYSISIPVTDIGIGVEMKVDKNGNFSIKH